MCNEGEPWAKQAELDESLYFQEAFWDTLCRIADKIGAALDYEDIMARIDDLVGEGPKGKKKMMEPVQTKIEQPIKEAKPAQMGLF